MLPQTALLEKRWKSKREPMIIVSQNGPYLWVLKRRRATVAYGGLGSYWSSVDAVEGELPHLKKSKLSL